VEVHSCREEIPSALRRDGVADERERERETWKRARIRVRGEGGGNERRAKESVWSTARRGILRQRYVRGDLAVAVTCQRKRRKEAEREEGEKERERGKTETREDSRGQDREFQELLSGLSTVVCVSGSFVPDRALKIAHGKLPLNSGSFRSENALAASVSSVARD